MSKTVREFRAELVLQGKTTSDWARENGFSLRSVQAVLYGQNKGLFGNAKKIRVALGLGEPDA